MRRRLVRILIAGVALTALAPAPASASKLVTFDTPSRFVDIAAEPVGPPATGNPPRPNNLGVNVLLPDGYSKRNRRGYPVLYLLHGAAQAYDHWAEETMGNAAALAKDFPGIIVMPQGGVIGFYSDYLNGAPKWESYYLRELMPLIERRFNIRAGRRWHAIAGLSMGGYGAMYLASQRPGYFGSAASFSGVLSPQDDEALTVVGSAIIPAAVGKDFPAEIWGDPSGFYAVGHNPTQVIGNLAHTRLFVSSGNATPCPGDGLGQDFGGLGPQASPAFNPPLFDPFVPGLLIGLETITRSESDVFTRAAERIGADITVQRPCGIHWWETFRRGFAEALEWDLLRGPGAQRTWEFTTASDRADAWGLRLRLPDGARTLTRLRRDGRWLTGDGAGGIELRGRCRWSGTLPFRLDLRADCR